MSTVGNPAIATVERAANAQGIMTIPWVKLPLNLGTGFDTKAGASKSRNPFKTREFAFDIEAITTGEVAFHRPDSCVSSYLSNITSSSGRSSDHLSLSLGVGIGNDFVGASVIGSYDRSVLDNSSTVKESRRTSFEAGAIHFPRSPALSAEAQNLLQSEGYASFVDRYGDFYISAFVLGADAGVLSSEIEGARNTRDHIQLQAEGHFLGISDTETIMKKDFDHPTSASQIGITAFDTLNDEFVDFPARDGEALRWQDARKVASDYNNRVERMPQRVAKRLSEMVELAAGAARVEWRFVHAFAQSGLVARIVLVPFATHRDVRQYSIIASD